MLGIDEDPGTNVRVKHTEKSRLTEGPGDDKQYSHNKVNSVDRRNVRRMTATRTHGRDCCIHADDTEDDYAKE